MKIIALLLLVVLGSLGLYVGFEFAKHERSLQPKPAEVVVNEVAEPEPEPVSEPQSALPVVVVNTIEPALIVVRELEIPSPEGFASRAAQRYVTLIDTQGRDLVSEILEVNQTSLRVRRYTDLMVVEIPFERLCREDRIFAEHLWALKPEPALEPDTAIAMFDAPSRGANGRSSGAGVPFDLPQFRAVLSQCRLHSPVTKGNIAVKRGQFGGYELPGRFHLGNDGTTMILATTRSGRDRSELRHNSSWSLLGEEKSVAARLRFDKPVAMEGKSRLHVLQIYTTGRTKGPMVLVSWSDGDRLGAYVRGSKWHDLGHRPDGFFDLDVSVKAGRVRISINKQLKVDDDVSQYADGSRAFFKLGAYHRGIEPHAVEFASLSIKTQ